MKVKLSKNFVNRCEECGITDLDSFVKELISKFVPVQELSGAMKESTQCSFNIERGVLTVIDPFNLFDCEQKVFSLKSKSLPVK